MNTAYEYIAGGSSRWFTLDEWEYEPTGLTPEILKYVSWNVISQMDRLRDLYGMAILPSKVPGGWARFTGSAGSRHYAKHDLAIAGDMFPTGDVLECWLKALTISAFGGFGLYLDTKRSEIQPGPMMHLDLRLGARRFWVRKAGEYTLLHEDPKKFWKLVAEVAEA